MGIPANNLYNLIVGSIYNIDKDTGTYIKNWTNGYSANYIKSQYNDALDNGMVGKAKANLKTWAYMYSVNLGDEEIAEIITLEKQGLSASPKINLTSYVNEKGEKIDLTKVQQSEFSKYYSLASKQAAETFKLTDYKYLNDETKASTLKKLYDSYYGYAKAKILGIQGESKIVNLLLTSNGQLGLSKILVGINALSSIKATVSKTRKELVMEQINKMTGFSKAEKLLLVPARVQHKRY